MRTELYIDIAAVVIVLISCMIAARNGFLKSVVNFVANIVSAAAAFFLCNAAASYIYDWFIKNNIADRFAAASKQGSTSDAIANIQDIVSKIPFFFADKAAVTTQVQGMAQTLMGKSTEEAMSLITDAVIKPIAISGISVIAFLIIFFVVRLVLRFVTKILTSILDKTPFLGGINSFLGGIFGLLQGLLILVVISILLKMAFSYTSQIWFLTPSLIDNTYGFKYIYDLNVMDMIKSLAL